MKQEHAFEAMMCPRAGRDKSGGVLPSATASIIDGMRGTLNPEFEHCPGRSED